MDRSQKLQNVVNKIANHGLDGFLFSSQPSVFYLSRFRSTHAYVLLTSRGEKVLITDSRYTLKAEQRLKPLGWEVVEIKAPLFANLANLLRDFGIKKLSVEGDRLQYQFLEKLKCHAFRRGIEIVPLSGFLDEFRMVKTPEEVELICRAVEITDNAFQNLVSYLKENRHRLGELKETDLRRFLICEYLKMGAEGESFPAIVAVGENSAIPHHETSETPLKENAPLLIDTGCVYKGYCSDFTRMLFIGNPERELLKIYDIVREAHLRAVEAAKVGATVGEVDLAAREYIESKGYGRYFTHSTGHGVGIEIHEPPRVYKNDKAAIRKGMVFTIEPGIYIPGKGGVRLENIVIVTDKGAEILQKTSLDVVII